MDNVTTIVRAADVETMMKLLDAKLLSPEEWRAYCRMLGAVAAAREQDELDNAGNSKKFKLHSATNDKILFIKFLRELFGLGLKEAKDLAEKVMDGGFFEVPADKLDHFTSLAKTHAGGYANYNNLTFVEIP